MATPAGPIPDVRPDLAGQVAVITGSTRGIGLASAHRLVAAGAQVVLNSRTGADESDSLGSFPPDAPVAFCASDVSTVAGAEHLAHFAQERFGRIDLLVNNASPGVKVDFFDRLTPEDWRWTIDGKMFTTINCIHAVLPMMKVQERGCIINIVSDAARVGTAGESMVSAAYGGVIALTKSLAREFARHQIRMNCVSITLTTDTPAYERIIADEVRSKIFTKIASKMPFGVLDPDDTAQAVEYFALARRVTGQTLSVNSGLSFPG
ncbi:MAG TPA: SDR family oxidoreductase [Nocardioides sp.]|jgi:NAD(P)-dependent dehydrogenase (short-subunit alcohol dehydrogenase family)|uniref:SDR family NAD(P)-dependent oxidoreductase n=1 Tax=Nocardioides sp. TaxID=35761 RepID=UPI002E327C93|nr:SDR family oxidoreductase [Nocardioides sp.]HEX3930528.1 SDR family oxidoreductase [Nocardioides sp.]